MNLVIDIGNTRTKTGIFSGDDLLKHDSFPKIAIENIQNTIGSNQIKNCIYSTVAKKGNYLVSDLKKLFPVLLLDEKTPVPFKSKYQTPSTLGNDRKANIAGAMKLFPGKDVLVIDVGTCLKTDFINEAGEYLGGSISPGLEMRFKSLKHFTARLPLVTYESFDELTGNSTKNSILSGVINGMMMEIEGFIEKYDLKYSNLSVILTGGDTYVFDKNLKISIFVAPYLSLSGLNEILIYNVERNKS